MSLDLVVDQQRIRTRVGHSPDRIQYGVGNRTLAVAE